MALRVGIVSAAWGGFAHLPAWRAIPGVEVTAICTSRQETAEAAAARLGVARPFWDAEAMCADPDIDIVDCGTRPGGLHDHRLDDEGRVLVAAEPRVGSDPRED